MATEQSNQRANPNPTPLTTQPLALWGRPLAFATAVLFFLSSTFPVIAGWVQDTASFPKWIGMLDVGIAFILVILAFAIIGLVGSNVSKQAEAAGYRVYRKLTHGLLAMIVVFFLFGDRIIWINCLPGFAWRTWLLLYGLPAWLTTLRGKPDSQDIRAEPFAAAGRPCG